MDYLTNCNRAGTVLDNSPNEAEKNLAEFQIRVVKQTRDVNKYLETASISSSFEELFIKCCTRENPMGLVDFKRLHTKWLKSMREKSFNEFMESQYIFLNDQEFISSIFADYLAKATPLYSFTEFVSQYVAYMKQFNFKIKT